ncbi:MAG: hypothetical protein Kow0059_02020 [Candidatus Sumerlaeia bacterium]
MNGQQAAEFIVREQRFLMNIVKGFRPDDGEFRPAPGMMTVAQQVHHVARTIRWFMEGAFGAGFDLDFEKFERENMEHISLEAAIQALREAYEDYITLIGSRSEAELAAPLPSNRILGEVPRLAVVFANQDHTAHHRGALSVYLRLLGRKPEMVYA